MQDPAGHDAPQPDTNQGRHTLTVRDVEALFAEAGVHRSHRHVLRLCQSGMLDAVKIPSGPSGEEWYVTPASVPKAIGDLQQIDARRARRDATQPAMSSGGDLGNAVSLDTDVARQGALKPAASSSETLYDLATLERDTAGHATTDVDIYDHPYVRRLETQVENLDAKYEAQVRRTEEIQLKGQEKLLELQRMTAVGQSQTLAQFMLKAKDMIVGPVSDTDEQVDQDREDNQRRMNDGAVDNADEHMPRSL